MEKVLGMTAEEMNLYFYSYMNKLPQTEKYKLSLANSIWFTDDDRFTVNKDFLQINGDYYGSDIYKAPFSTETLNNINEWVKNKTDGMIPKILEEISDGAVMYLVNALAFNAEWAEIFDEDHVREGVFTDENGNEQNVEFMYGEDHVYYEDEYATGFMKYYVDCKYGFVALIPNEGVSVADYVKTLNGESLNNMLNNPVHTTVYTSIPKFETEYDVQMGGKLAKMGMPDAFDEYNANFSKLGTSEGRNIYIGSVTHKTFISVGEKGTKAGAATVVEMSDTQAEPPTDIKEVNLDRPFVYMIVDCENNIPLFIGTMMNVNN
jgi:serpin B